MKISKDNNLLAVNSKLCKEWSSKNKLGAENYMPNCHEKVWWICKECNEAWKARIDHRNRGSNCPFCSGRCPTKENNLLVINPELCKEWSSKNQFKPQNCTSNSGKRVWWLCKVCNHEWEATIDNRNKGRGCKFCSGKKATKKNNLLVKNPNLCKEWDYNKNINPENYMNNSHEKVWWICKNNHEWEAIISNRNKGSGCPHCSGRLPTEENNLLIKNKELCDQWDYNKNKLNPENYSPNSHEKVWWVCKKCNEGWEATIDNRNAGRGCRFCAGKEASKDNNLLIKNPNLCKEWSDKNEFGPENYTPGLNKKVWWICKNNHEWEATINSRNSGCGCRKCSQSISNLSQKWLNKLNIQIREFKIPYTNYIVDGYDPETNTIYEFYGDKWHGNPNIFNPSDVNPCNKKLYSELYNKTIKRENILKLMGYKLITIWESDFKKELKDEK